MFKPIYEKKLSLAVNGELQHKAVKEDKIFYMLLLSRTLIKYKLHHAHDDLGQVLLGLNNKITVLLEGITKTFQHTCKALYKMQTTESVPTELCTTTLRSAVSTYAFYCNGHNR